MYVREDINCLYEEYASSRDDRILWKLVEALRDVINIIVSRWDNLNFQERLDTCQEMCLQLFRNLQRRTTENLVRYIIAPLHYLYSYLRMLSHRIWWSNYSFGIRTDSEGVFPDKSFLNDGMILGNESHVGQYQ